MSLPRRHRFDRALSLVLAAVLVLAARSAQADPLYTITDLGQVNASALNNAGEVIGNGITTNGSYSDPFVYQSYGPAAGTMTDLSSALGPSAIPLQINDSGQIAGSVSTPDGYRGFVYGGGQLALIQPLPGTLASYIFGLNNSGAVVGVSGGDGYINQGGRMIDLGVGYAPVAISKTGLVVGGGPDGAFVYQGGSMTTIVSGTSGASSVNSSGETVGWYHPPSASPGSQNAFLYQDGHVTNLGTLGGPSTVALGINDQGQVVGSSQPASYQVKSITDIGSHAFLYQNGIMTDLNTLISPSSGWTLQLARAINDNGQILGSGIGPDDKTDTFLLTPASEPPPVVPQIPEPSTLAFFGLVAAGVVLRRARHRR